tara:strand:+ start:573 stop:1820 length:1248 start_codon:yes stop_codon:yes gene_type:complete
MTQKNLNEVNIKPSPSSYEAYSYSFCNCENGKTYLGIHKGAVNDIYSHSSQNPEFQDAFVDGKTKFDYSVLNYGTYDAMRNYEHRALSAVDARNNPMWYNLHNGASPYLTPDIGKCKHLRDDIKNGVFPETDEDVEDHVYMDKVQPRFDSHVTDKVAAITSRINDAGGNTEKCDPVIVFEQCSPDGDDIRINGSHTVEGIDRSEHGKVVRTIRVPFDVAYLFSDRELDAIGNMFNKKGEIISSPIDKQTGVKFLTNNSDAGIPVDDPTNEEWLIEYGFSSSERKSIITKAKNEVAKGDFLKQNQNWMNYTTGAASKKIKSVVEAFNNKTGVSAYYTSSLNIKMDKLLEKAKATYDMGDESNKTVVVLYHPTPEAKKTWETDTNPIWFGEDGILPSVLKEECEISIHEMPCVMSTN